MHIQLRGTKNITRVSLAFTAALFSLSFGLIGQVSALDNSSALTTTKHGFCLSHDVPVALAQGQPLNQKIHATYCQPFSWAQGSHQVDVLTEGATYNSTYWLWPQNPSLYSYADKTLDAGRAVLAYDRLGSGKSSHPVSTDITMPGDAYVLHQLVQGLKLVGYKKINSIGHSYGSGIAIRESATYNDVSRVVLTGYLHSTGRNPVVATATYPANLDPAFAGQGLDSGYLTSTPATSTSVSGRQAAFYYSSADQAVINFDDAHKDLVTVSGFGGYFADKAAPAGSNLSNQIKAPVLLIDGRYDAVFCFDPSIGGLDCSNASGVKSHELPYYTGATNVTFAQVANTGHDLTLHPSANQSFKTINQWIKSH